VTPFREAYWNIPAHRLIYFLFLPFLAVFVWGCVAAARRWLGGRPDHRLDHPWTRLTGLLAQGAAQLRILRETYAGILHASLFWGFVVLFAATCMVMLEEYLGIPTLRGPFYLYFMSLVVDVFGIAALIGIGMAMVRRWVLRPARLREPRNSDRYSALLILTFLILVSGFVVEGARIIATRDPWAAWSPGGWLTAAAIGILPQAWMGTLHRYAWWGHAVLAFAFIAYLPFSGVLHILTAPLNIFFRSLQPMGTLTVATGTAVMAAEPSGPGGDGLAIEQFTWKHLLDLDACTECGRCQAVCPAWLSGTALSPKGLIMSLRDHLREHRDGHRPALAGEIVGGDAIWACFTCGACHEACPVFIEPIPKLIALRRWLVAQGTVDAHLQDALTAASRYGNSFGQSPKTRARWTQGLEIKIKDIRREPAEYLWFVGDFASYDPQTREATRATARLLHRAGIDFGILYDAEGSAGNDLRRVGEEGLFEMLAEKNLAAMRKCQFEKILTTDPHTYNTLKHEYPGLGATWPVVHYSELFDRLCGEGRLRPTAPRRGRVTYHDPCYLGRYNGVFDAPRRVLQTAGAEVVEMPRNRANSYCCGAGGGRVWMHDVGGVKERPAESRVREAASLAGVDTLVVACPKELAMFRDAVKTAGLEGRLAVKDLAELLDEATTVEVSAHA
jgi:Fe-S oxidoreductase/nitrate reductase gamma subunit